jgi:hypothetical protein
MRDGPSRISLRFIRATIYLNFQSRHQRLSARSRARASSLMLRCARDTQKITIALYAWLAASLPNAACAAAKRAIGTRNGEQDT